MKITWHCAVGQPRPDNLPLLVWQYLLDIMLNDAGRTRLNHLEVFSRWDSWMAGRGIDASPPAPSDVRGDGIALLGLPPAAHPWAHPYRRAYVLIDRWAFLPTLSPSYQLDQQYFLGTWRSQLAGGLMRLGEALHRPDIVDRAVHRVRQEFLSTVPTLARYTLTIYRRIGDDKEESVRS
ncbi:MAG: hypothetical protein OWU84_06150 [Firmicutes bacterium]|nr:hypothetical protein [Bacillota bacterium]